MNIFLQITLTAIMSGAVSFIMTLSAIAAAIKRIKNEDNAQNAKSNKKKE